VDYVLIYSADNFVNVPNSANDNRTKEMFDIWQREGGILRNFASLSQHLTDNYYKGCYERLYVFQLTEYDRVVIMDADGLAVNDLDHLFWLAMPKDVQVSFRVPFPLFVMYHNVEKLM
jgi:lipopolysaccharide biosynthesis glycosyltransferase